MPATLQSRLPAIAAELRPRVSRAVKEGADDIVQQAKERVPRRTGALRDAIQSRPAGAAQRRVVAGDGEVFYGRFIEFGTRFIEAEPFLVPAAEAEEDRIAERVTLVLRGL